MKNTKQKNLFRIFKRSKYIEADYSEDLESIIDKYKEKGYRDARIVSDTLIKNKNNTIYSVAGGGDTVSLLNNIGATESFNFVSTAGGAFLEYLEGKELPGIKALN